MGHFLRWLKGLVICFIGGAVMVGPPVYLLYIATLIPELGVLFFILAIMVAASGIVLIFYGRYIMKEEAPKGRYRIEQ